MINKLAINYTEQAKKIWNEEVPQDGQSLTVHGELIRSIEKLRDEAQRNGNGNRDEGHQIMLAYIGETLLNHSAFTEETKSNIIEVLTELKESERVVVDDSPYDYLTQRVIEHREYVGEIARVINPILLR